MEDGTEIRRLKNEEALRARAGAGRLFGDLCRGRPQDKDRGPNLLIFSDLEKEE